MMDNDRFEHLIKRKRKRHSTYSAVDPCLGFYPPTFSEPSAVEIPSLLSHENSVQELQLDPTDMERSAKKPRTYARKRPIDDPDTEQEASPALLKRRRRSNPLLIHSPPPEQSNIRPPKSRRRRHPLAQRLLHAAVLSGVDPVDSLIEPDPNAPLPTRRPLQFQAETESLTTSPPGTKRRPSWGLVDPHKSSSSIRTASFISRKERETLTPRENYKPLTRWPSRPNLKTTKKKNLDYGPAKKKTSTTDMQYQRRPLTFVPIQKSDLLLSRPGSGFPQARDPTPDKVKSRHAIRPPLIPVFAASQSISAPPAKSPPIDSINQPRSPTTATHSTNMNPPRTSIPQIQIPSAPTAPVSSPGPEPSSSDFNAPAPIVLCPATSPAPITSQANTPAHIVPPTDPLLAPERPSDRPSVLNLHPINNHPKNTFNPLSRSMSNKPAKPLSSFFDEFLETVRAATSATQHQQTQMNNLPPRSVFLYVAVQCLSAAIQTYRYRDVEEDDVFDEWTSRAAPAPEEEEKIGIGESWLSRGGPLSPDLLVALRPSQYQVTLSQLSPPSSSRAGALRNAMAGLRAFYG
ncbi:hypothetical protein BT96DRAFT_998555 [Gymnopus androsaceus JB14]|uniref:Uncharacterized protein n=1 Tax=Gymnopus androsaceus JB14 TaxID=1447944 RepID=A0A6A4H876_9AGAR|nr:hypothetical protein BT96DRAFT_998555 [Gymnopus androsaceus JB14]